MAIGEDQRGSRLYTASGAGNDPKKQAEVFGLVMMLVLADASSEDNFIDCPASALAAAKLIEGLDEKGLKEWQDGVKAGIEMGDWASLISHCKFWIVPSSLHSDRII